MTVDALKLGDTKRLMQLIKGVKLINYRVKGLSADNGEGGAGLVADGGGEGSEGDGEELRRAGSGDDVAVVHRRIPHHAVEFLHHRCKLRQLVEHSCGAYVSEVTHQLRRFYRHHTPLVHVSPKWVVHSRITSKKLNSKNSN